MVRPRLTTCRWSIRRPVRSATVPPCSRTARSNWNDYLSFYCYSCCWSPSRCRSASRSAWPARRSDGWKCRQSSSGRSAVHCHSYLHCFCWHCCCCLTGRSTMSFRMSSPYCYGTRPDTDYTTTLLRSRRGKEKLANKNSNSGWNARKCSSPYPLVSLSGRHSANGILASRRATG